MNFNPNIVGGTSIADLKRKKQHQKNDQDMQNMVSHINNELQTPDHDNTEDTDDISEPTEKHIKFTDNVIYSFKEIILLLLIYVVLHADIIKKMLSNFTQYLEQNEDGSMPIIGLLIYGLLISVLFIISRKIFISH